MRSSATICLALCLTGCFFESPPVEKDTRAYPKLLAEWKTYGLADHFPGSIPSHATNVIFSSSPGMLQGDAWLQLRQGLSEAEIRELHDEAQKTARQYHDGGNSTSHMSGTPESSADQLPSPSFHTSGSEEPKHSESFPSDYRIFILDAQAYKTNSTDPNWYGAIVPKVDWNHGTSRGVAISLERNEVVYWAESW